MEPAAEKMLMTGGLMEAFSCQVCYTKYDNEDNEATILPCGHTFCSKCIKGSYSKCPTCRKYSTDEQVTKNYLVHTLVDEMNQIIIKNQQTAMCNIHKIKLERYCKPCARLMCNNCQCRHKGSLDCLLSVDDLRGEVEKIFESYITVEQIKRDFEQEVNYVTDIKTSSIEKNQAFSAEEIRKVAAFQIVKIIEEKEKIMDEAEEEAEAKIKVIEDKKLGIIKEAINSANAKIMEIETHAAALLEEVYSKNKVLLDSVKNISKGLQEKIDAVRDLSQLKSDTLEECATIYKLDEQQMIPLQEFLALSGRNIEEFFKESSPKQSLELEKAADFLNTLVKTSKTLESSKEDKQDKENKEEKKEERKELTYHEKNKLQEESIEKRSTGFEFKEKFSKGETIDCLNNSNEWVNAMVTNIQNNEVLVRYSGRSKIEEWINVNSPRLLKQWRKGNEFQVCHRIDVLDGSKIWREAIVVKIFTDEIQICYMQAMKYYCRLPKNSNRIAEIGTYSQAYGVKRQI